MHPQSPEDLHDIQLPGYVAVHLPERLLVVPVPSGLAAASNPGIKEGGAVNTPGDVYGKFLNKPGFCDLLLNLSRKLTAHSGAFHFLHIPVI